MFVFHFDLTKSSYTASVFVFAHDLQPGTSVFLHAVTNAAEIHFSLSFIDYSFTQRTLLTLTLCPQGSQPTSMVEGRKRFFLR